MAFDVGHVFGCRVTVCKLYCRREAALYQYANVVSLYTMWIVRPLSTSGYTHIRDVLLCFAFEFDTALHYLFPCLVNTDGKYITTELRDFSMQYQWKEYYYLDITSQYILRE